MKIKFDEIKNEFLRHCIVHSLVADKKKGDKVIKKAHKNGYIEIKFSMFDMEFPLIEWFNQLDKEINRQVEEKFIDFEDEINDAIYDFKEKFKNWYQI